MIVIVKGGLKIKLAIDGKGKLVISATLHDDRPIGSSMVGIVTSAYETASIKDMLNGQEDLDFLD